MKGVPMFPKACGPDRQNIDLAQPNLLFPLRTLELSLAAGISTHTFDVYAHPEHHRLDFGSRTSLMQTC